MLDETRVVFIESLEAHCEDEEILLIIIIIPFEISFPRGSQK